MLLARASSRSRSSRMANGAWSRPMKTRERAIRPKVKPEQLGMMTSMMMMLLKCRTLPRLRRTDSSRSTSRYHRWARQASLSTHRHFLPAKPAWHDRTLRHSAQLVTSVRPVRLLTSRSTTMTRSSQLARRNGRQQVIHRADPRVPTIPQRAYPSRSGLRLTFRSPLRIFRDPRHTDRSALDSRCAHLRRSHPLPDRNHHHGPHHSPTSILLHRNMHQLVQSRKVRLWPMAAVLSTHRSGRRRKAMLHHSRL